MKNTSNNRATTLPKAGIVFGVFDGLHDGHRYLITECAKHCETLVVVVTLDAVVSMLKNHPPKYSYEERVEAIRNFNPNLTIVPSDPTLGGWSILERHRPDIIFLGYDQDAIASEMKRLKRRFTFIDAHHPDTLHSSILNA
jgi:cytidyltransferase-like protein